MGHKMKYTKGGFPFKTDLLKKEGLGPRTNKAMSKQFPQGDDKFIEDQEAKELMRRQIIDDPGNKYDPSKDKE